MADLIFQYAPGALAGIKALGQGGPPADGHYAVDILRIEATDKAGQGKVILRIPLLAEYQQTAHEGEVFDWVKLVQLENPNASTDIDTHNKWAAKNTRTILESIGYEPALIDQGAPGNGWMIGRRAYVSYVAPQQGVAGSYADVTFINPRQFSDLRASGVKPSRRAASGAAENATAPPAGSYAPPPPPPSGGGQYIAPPAAPPAPGSVQNGHAAPPPAPPAPTGYAAPPPPPPPPAR